MLVIIPKSNSLDRALKRYKKKSRQTKLPQSVRKRMFFRKPSEKRRKELEKARKRHLWILSHD